ncbi:MAG TPA: TATA-box-binding protein [Thermoplasmatales archaeon]|nr:TATA-box-binding protein [Thermoplasmatales archaeon]
MVDIVVENVVVSAQVADEIDLEKASQQLPEAEYNPTLFPGLTLRSSSPRAAVLLFSSGKAVCTGAKNIDDAKNAVKKVCSMLDSKGFTVHKNPKITVQNIVVSANLKKKMDLESVAVSLKTKVEYQPEQFPGLIYRTNSDIVLLVFSSGKVVGVGGKSKKEMRETLKSFIAELTSAEVIEK